MCSCLTVLRMISLDRFNRTGFMICSYLIQEQKYSVAEALQHFEQARPPRGIRYSERNIGLSRTRIDGKLSTKWIIFWWGELGMTISKVNSTFDTNHHCNWQQHRRFEIPFSISLWIPPNQYIRPITGIDDRFTCVLMPGLSVKGTTYVRGHFYVRRWCSLISGWSLSSLQLEPKVITLRNPTIQVNSFPNTGP
jgi:hypothetical protein